ncbi:MAG: hypothetical protein V6Z86_08935 [Hyphomicrobiales bacterium]
MAGVVDEAIHAATTDPTCTEKKDSKKKKSKEKDPDKEDLDHSFSA